MRWIAKLKSFVESTLTEITVVIMIVMSFSGIGLHWVFAHLIGDYFLQTDEMAINKKLKGVDGDYACFMYVVSYMIPFCFLTDFNLVQILLIGAQHYIQDRTYFVQWFMVHTGSEKFTKEPMAPWSLVVVDNIFHLIWIAIVAQLY